MKKKQISNQFPAVAKWLLLLAVLAITLVIVTIAGASDQPEEYWVTQTNDDNGVTYQLKYVLADGKAVLAQYRNETDLDLSLLNVPNRVYVKDGEMSLENHEGDPAWIQYPVVGVAEKAFSPYDAGKQGNSIKKVCFAQGIALARGAFKDNVHIVEVHLASDLTEIPANAFEGCTALTAVYGYESVVTIDENAFMGCISLEKAPIGAAVQRIGKHAFDGCSAITKVSFGDALQTIGARAFINCTALSKIESLGGVKTIGAYAFSNTAVTYLPMSDSLEVIETSAFEGSGLVVVKSGKNLRVVQDKAFYNHSLAYFDIGFAKSSAKWGSNVFNPELNVAIHANDLATGWDRCAGLSETGEWVDEVEYAQWIFTSEVVLDFVTKELTLSGEGVSVTDSGSGLTYQLKSAKVDDVTQYTAVVIGLSCENRETADRILRIPAKVYYSQGQNSYLEFDVVGIQNASGAGSNEYIGVVVPANVKDISADTFASFTCLKDIYLQNKDITVNGVQNNLHNVWQSYRVIVDWGYAGASANHLYTNYPLDSLGKDQQGVYYYTGYTEEGDMPYALVGDNGKTDDTRANTSQYSGSDAYSGQWGHVILPDYVSVDNEYFQVVGLGAHAFYHCDTLKHLDLGAFVGTGDLIYQGQEGDSSYDMTINTISDASLRNCLRLTSFSVDSRNLRYWSDGAVLYECSIAPNKTSIPNKILKAGKDVTSWSASARTNEVTTVDNYAFANCLKLESFEFSRISEIIGHHAFDNTGLTGTVTLSGVEVGDYAFSNNTKLANVVLGSGVSLGRQVFANCHELQAFSSTSSRYVTDEIGVLYEMMDGYAVLLQFPAAADQVIDNFTYEYTVNTLDGYPVREIEAYAFVRSPLRKIVIGENVYFVGKAAFRDSGALMRTEFGANVMAIGIEMKEEYLSSIYFADTENFDRTKYQVYEREVFNGCQVLYDIDVSSDNKYYHADSNGVLYNADKTTLLVYAPGISRVSYTVPSSVKHVGLEAFQENVHLRRVILPETLQSLGAKAFNGCVALYSVYFRTLKAPRIGEQAFNSAGALADANQPFRVYCIPEPGVWLEGCGERWDDYRDRVEKYVAIQEVPNQAQPTAEIYLLYVSDTDGNSLPGFLVEYWYKDAATDSSGYTIKKAIVNEQGYAVIVLPVNLNRLLPGNAIKLCIEDPEGEYFTHESAQYSLDLQLGYSTVTMRSVPSVHGLTLDGDNIDTERVSINVAGMYDSEKMKVSFEAYWDSAADCQDVTFELWLMVNGSLHTRLDGGKPETATDKAGPVRGGIYSLSFTAKQIRDVVHPGVISKGDSYKYCLKTVVKLDGKEHVTYTNLNMDVFCYDYGEKEVELGFFEGGFFNDTSLFKVDDGVPVLGGFEMDFEFDFQDMVEAELGIEAPEWFDGITIVNDRDQIHVIMNIYSKDLTPIRCEECKKECKADSQVCPNCGSTEFILASGMEYERGESFADELEDELDDRLEAMIGEDDDDSFSSSKNLTISVAGVLTFEKSSLHDPEYLSEVAIKGVVQFHYEMSKTFVIVVVPVCLELEFDAEGSIQVVMRVDDTPSFEDLRLDIAAEIALQARLGLGCAVVSAGVYGELGLEVELSFSSEMGTYDVSFHGELGAYVKVDVIIFKKTYRWVWVDSKNEPIWYTNGLFYDKRASASKLATGCALYTEDEEIYLFDSAADAYAFAIEDAHNNTVLEPLEPGADYEEYGGANSEIVTYDGQTYRFYIDNVALNNIKTKPDGINNYNYYKLVYSMLLAEGKWTDPVVVSDNCYNEIAYAVMADQDGIHLLIERANSAIDAQNKDDFLNMQEIVYMTYNNSSFSQPEVISATSYFKSNLHLQKIDGVIYGAWAENSDGNIFGTQTYEGEGEEQEPADVNKNANSVVYTCKDNGQWADPITVDQLPTVLDLAFFKRTSQIEVLAVLDKDGDLTTEDSALYAFAWGESSFENATKQPLKSDLSESDSPAELIWGNGVLYIKAGAALYQASAIDGKGFDCTLFVSGVGSKTRLVYRPDGELFAIMYLVSRSQDCDELFVRLYVDGKFTSEMLVSVLEENQSVEYYAPYWWNHQLMLALNAAMTTYDSEGTPIKTTYMLKESALQVRKDVLLEHVFADRSSIVAGEQFELSLKIRNVSLEYLNDAIVQLLDAQGNVVGQVALSELQIAPGASKQLTVPFTLSSFTESYTVRVLVDGDVDTVNNEQKAQLAAPDLHISAKYTEVGGIKYMLVLLYNKGQLPAKDFTIYVENGINFHALTQGNYLYELSSGDLVLQPGEYHYYTIELNRVYFTENYVTISVSPVENELNTENNIASYSMELNQPVEMGTQYTLTVYLDGKVMYTDSYLAGAAVDMAAITSMVPHKEGHSFGGWSLTLARMPAYDISIYGYYKTDRYNVNYYVDGVLYSVDEVEYGARIPVLNNLSKEGFSFSGWQLPGDVNADKMPAHDVNIYATFTKNTYRVTYYVNNTEYIAYEGSYGDSVEIPTYTAPEGYTFGGWSTRVTTIPSHNVNVYGYYAANAYKVRYYLDGELYTTQSVLYGAKIPVLQEPVKEGYTFGGWKMQDGVGATMPTHDVEVHGSFTINRYTVRYYVNSALYQVIEKNYGESFTAPVYTAKEGYEFSGWSRELSVMPAENVNIYGTTTQKQYTLKYYVRTETGEYRVEYTTQVPYDVTIPYYKYQATEGYSFGGWKDANGNAVVESDNLKMPASDLALYGTESAKTYTVTYYFMGFRVHSQTVKFGQVIPSYVYTANGHSYSTWEGLPEIMPARDLTTYCEEEKNVYYVKYFIDGEFVYSDAYPAGVVISLRTAENKEGHTFGGWTSIKNEEGSNISLVGDKMPEYNICVYGTYRKNTYQLYYYVDTILWKTERVAYGQSIVPSQYTPAAGYSFNGFVGVPDTMPAQDVTVYGKTERLTYTITYYVDDKLVHTEPWQFDMSIIPYAYTPAEGYEVGEWKGLPQTMPASDLTVTAYTRKLSYNLSYYVDNELVKTVSYLYGKEIAPYVYTAPTGRLFLGFEGEPETMPAGDLAVYGVTVAHSYKLNYYVDGEMVYGELHAYGEALELFTGVQKYGYTFGGWENAISTMPASDVELHAIMTPNTHSVFYYINDELVYTDSCTYGQAVQTRADEAKTGYEFSGWLGAPEIMGDEDVTVKGYLTARSYQVTYYINDTVYKTESLPYGTELELPKPETEQYTVTGWSCDGVAIQTLKVGDGDIRLDATVQERPTPFLQSPIFLIAVSCVGTAVVVGGIFVGLMFGGKLPAKIKCGSKASRRKEM